ncbi:inovirus Gp2 family protein [Lysobacter sp. MMG2]|uniref:YagK/YfjJ domain-containing protein n=1 Tax=Lysobacter sp. MMG2 TaxID=2801338 RepID=UPI001C21F15B|nr:inovirus-type Gp2 protein [Lysobacter sp. MMG2]MBU8976882.1 inovirus Gp2 family protein [Lysobacter sp. MMG2]
MQDKDNLLQRHWTASTPSWTGKRWLITHEHDSPRILMEVDRLMADLAKNRKDLFWRGHRRRGGEQVEACPLGRRLERCAGSFDPGTLRSCLARHTFSPYFQLLERNLDTCPIRWEGLCPENLDALNQWIDELRRQVRSEPFSKRVADHERAARKNAASLRQYLDGLFDRYAKMLVVRLDVGYRHDPAEPAVIVTDAQAKEDLTQMLGHIRKLPGQVGYVWKREYGAIKGHHTHLMVLFNGHQVREGISWGKLLGQKWQAITERGVYWNCNAHADAYRLRGCLGIGLIHHADVRLRQGLEQAAMYLAKVDYYARLVGPEIGRVFGKGVLPGRHSGRGRPRQTSPAQMPVADDPGEQGALQT